ncbi:hypothetical protein OF83DRAFT_103059 [Amylostereum chailletii]|nr:hypothetical protein OF83DRAFT_103059 [Amylostereum chailletii]
MNSHFVLVEATPPEVGLKTVDVGAYRFILQAFELSAALFFLFLCSASPCADIDTLLSLHRFTAEEDVKEKTDRTHLCFLLTWPMSQSNRLRSRTTILLFGGNRGIRPPPGVYPQSDIGRLDLGLSGFVTTVHVPGPFPLSYTLISVPAYVAGEPMTVPDSALMRLTSRRMQPLQVLTMTHMNVQGYPRAHTTVRVHTAWRSSQFDFRSEKLRPLNVNLVGRPG